MRELRRAKAVTRGDLRGVVRDDPVRESRECDERGEDGGTRDRATILGEPPERIAKQAARRPGETAEGGGVARIAGGDLVPRFAADDHETRMRGSRNPYETSTARLTTTYTTDRKSVV